MNYQISQIKFYIKYFMSIFYIFILYNYFISIFIKILYIIIILSVIKKVSTYLNNKNSAKMRTNSIVL